MIDEKPWVMPVFTKCFRKFLYPERQWPNFQRKFSRQYEIEGFAKNK